MGMRGEEEQKIIKRRTRGRNRQKNVATRRKLFFKTLLTRLLLFFYCFFFAPSSLSLAGSKASSISIPFLNYVYSNVQLLKMNNKERGRQAEREKERRNSESEFTHSLILHTMYEAS
jgi:hypothetical protein